MRSGMIPETVDPTGAQALPGRNRLQAAAGAMDDRVIGVHCQNGFDVADAVGVEPVNRSGHRLQGHVSYLHAVMGSGFGVGLMNSGEDLPSY